MRRGGSRGVLLDPLERRAVIGGGHWDKGKALTPLPPPTPHPAPNGSHLPRPHRLMGNTRKVPMSCNQKYYQIYLILVNITKNSRSSAIRYSTKFAGFFQVELDETVSILKYRDTTTRYRYQIFKVSKYQRTTGRMIFNVISGYQGYCLHSDFNSNCHKSVVLACVN